MDTNNGAAAMMTTTQITDTQIENLRNAAGQAGDFLMVAICDLAIDGEIDTDDYTALSRSDVQRVKGMTQDEAIAECAEAINDAAGRRK